MEQSLALLFPFFLGLLQRGQGEQGRGLRQGSEFRREGRAGTEGRLAAGRCGGSGKVRRTVRWGVLEEAGRRAVGGKLRLGVWGGDPRLEAGAGLRAPSARRWALGGGAPRLRGGSVLGRVAAAHLPAGLR